MKQRLIIALTLLLLAFHFPLLAQPYRQLPLYGARWKINYLFKNFPIDRGSFFMTTSGDTTIAGLPVTRIVVGQVAACSGMAIAYQTPAITYLHQDSLGRVYSIAPNGQMTKVYDLSLQPGDTMHTYYGGVNPIDYRVDSVGILQFADNIPRKALYMSYHDLSGSALFSPVVWVEGIGDIYNGPVIAPGVESFNEAACYQEAEMVLVTNPYALNSCVLNCDLLVSAEAPLTASTTVSPNPAHDQLRLTQADGQPLHVRLLALDGRVLGTWDLEGAAAHTLQLPAVPASLYLLELRDSEGRLRTQRLVLE